METESAYNEWLTGFGHLIYVEKAMSQKTLAQRVNVDKGYVNSILKGRKNAGVHLRDAISRALGMSYDHVRELGTCLLNGVPGEEALERARGTVASGHCVLPVMQVSGKAHVGNVVNNGVMSVGNDPVESNEPRDEIRAEIEGWLAECFGDMSMSQKIAAREAIRQGVPNFAAYIDRREGGNHAQETGTDQGAACEAAGGGGESSALSQVDQGA